MAQPKLQLDLSQLPVRDGTSRTPGGHRHTQLADSHLLDNLTYEFNTAENTRYWGIEFDFVGALPHGYSEWTHPTAGAGTAINEVFGHPLYNIVRSARRFAPHVDEIMRANEADVRNLIQGVDPNNVINNNAIAAGVQNQNRIRCNC